MMTAGPRRRGVDVLWTGPLNATAPVVLLVAAATSMGNISVVAAVLTAACGSGGGVGGELPPAGKLGCVLHQLAGFEPQRPVR